MFNIRYWTLSAQSCSQKPDALTTVPERSRGSETDVRDRTLCQFAASGRKNPDSACSESHRRLRADEKQTFSVSPRARQGRAEADDLVTHIVVRSRDTDGCRATLRGQRWTAVRMVVVVRCVVAAS